MKILEIVVMTHMPGTDQVMVHTDAPPPFPPSVSTDEMVMRFEVQKGRGAEYALKHFPEVPVSTLDARTGNRKLIR